jgi:Outer membrane protein beta-barrel domain
MRKQARLVALSTLFVFFALQQQAWAQSGDVPRYEAGAQFSTLTTNSPFNETKPGFGGRFTLNITDNVAAEAQGDFYPTNNTNSSEFTGGRVTSAVFGIKAGKRFERFGIYAKARPGLIHFARTLAGFHAAPTLGPPTAFVADFRARTEFATDIGGVLEFYPTRRIVTRFDIGDMIVRYGERTTNIPVLSGGATPTVSLVPFTQPPVTRHNFQFSAGIGFRF